MAAVLRHQQCDRAALWGSQAPLLQDGGGLSYRGELLVAVLCRHSWFAVQEAHDAGGIDQSIRRRSFPQLLTYYHRFRHTFGRRGAVQIRCHTECWCNDVQREGAKLSPGLASGLYCYVPLHKIWYGIPYYTYVTTKRSC